jgi:hypothetical protein
MTGLRSRPGCFSLDATYEIVLVFRMRAACRLTVIRGALSS